MGYEFKLKIKLSEKQTTEIQNLLESSGLFEKKYEFDDKLFWDFRHTSNKGKIPNISIIFEEDGIYICQWGSSYVWTHLENLKNYFLDKKIVYEIIDYQE